ncbi:MAG: glycosyltransferase [Sulfitobacter sp.]
MFNRVSQLFSRYASHHGQMKAPGFPLVDMDGEMFGMVDHILVQGGRLTVEGWCFASSVGLKSGGVSDHQTPSLTRSDVTSHYENDAFPTPGFSLNVRYDQGHTAFWVMHDDERYVFTLDKFAQADFTRMRRQQILPFTGAALTAIPAVARWYTTRDFAARARVKSILGLHETVASALVNEALFAEDGEPPLAASADTKITIVLPVYNAFHLLPDVLERVLAHTDLPYHLIIIEDKSTDEQVRPFLRSWHAALPEATRAHIEVLENEENLGFIRSVNRAFDRAISLGNHVVLLNSDAFVPQGWASRLLGPVLEHDNVATVTPMSNDAEIYNVPVICVRSDLEDGVADRIDAAAQKFASTAVLAEAPTGVGFCMAMNIKYLKLEPQLDTIFGRGYGEEVDWCRRVKARGGRHLGHAGLFVEHRGGTSFGSEEKLKLVLANNQIISQRYTGYDQMVQDFIHNDPMSSPRLALSLAWADAQAAVAGSGPVPVYIAHDMGGGAEHYLERRIEGDLETRAAAVVLRLGSAHRWKVEVHSEQGMVSGALEEMSHLMELMDLLSARHVVYSCAVGDRDPIEVPALLDRLSAGSAHSLDVLVHDFFPASPSYTLLDADGVYRGMPVAGHGDKAHQMRRPDGSTATLREWRQAWGATLGKADHVTVFSQNSADLMLQAYPDIAAQLRIMPHSMLHDVPQTPVGGGKDGLPVIGVLGNIGLQKGAKVLQDLSRHLAQTRQAHLVVVGNIDPAYALTAPAKVHGSYKLSDIPGLVQKYGITDWLMPSIWPETFSYAVHEVIATGLPVWSYDLGAQGDAARAAAQERGQGGVLELDLHDPEFGPMLDTILKDAKVQPDE